jgi:hypothetical protein
MKVKGCQNSFLNMLINLQGSGVRVWSFLPFDPLLAENEETWLLTEYRDWGAASCSKFTDFISLQQHNNT